MAGPTQPIPTPKTLTLPTDLITADAIQFGTVSQPGVVNEEICGGLNAQDLCDTLNLAFGAGAYLAYNPTQPMDYSNIEVNGQPAPSDVVCWWIVFGNEILVPGGTGVAITAGTGYMAARLLEDKWTSAPGPGSWQIYNMMWGNPSHAPIYAVVWMPESQIAQSQRIAGLQLQIASLTRQLEALQQKTEAPPV
jgi:hypothetical protein